MEYKEDTAGLDVHYSDFIMAGNITKKYIIKKKKKAHHHPCAQVVARLTFEPDGPESVPATVVHLVSIGGIWT